jgi:hypothetical protein
MTSKSVVALAAILPPVLMLGSLTLATAASARDNGRRGGGDHVAAVHVGAGHGPGAHVVAGHSGRAFVSGGHRRHLWHGRWWDYGVGPCWAWSDVTGGYMWVCD